MRFFVITCHNGCNVWSKTTLLLPVWPRDAKMLDTQGPSEKSSSCLVGQEVIHVVIPICVFAFRVFYPCFPALRLPRQVTTWLRNANCRESRLSSLGNILRVLAGNEGGKGEFAWTPETHVCRGIPFCALRKDFSVLHKIYNLNVWEVVRFHILQQSGSANLFNARPHYVPRREVPLRRLLVSV